MNVCVRVCAIGMPIAKPCLTAPFYGISSSIALYAFAVVVILCVLLTSTTSFEYQLNTDEKFVHKLTGSDCEPSSLSRANGTIMPEMTIIGGNKNSSQEGEEELQGGELEKLLVADGWDEFQFNGGDEPKSLRVRITTQTPPVPISDSVSTRNGDGFGVVAVAEMDANPVPVDFLINMNNSHDDVNSQQAHNDDLCILVG